MNKILLGTHNEAKLHELNKWLHPLTDKNIHLLTLEDLLITEEPEETGKTFEANALLKARFYSKLSGLPTIADDGGIMIDALNGEPGVKSNRWLEHKVSDQELVEYTLKRMQEVPKNKRTAVFRTCLCFYDPFTHHHLIEKADVEGIIAEEAIPIAINKFPYRGLFIVKRYNKYFSQLTEQEHQKINHRFKAVKALEKKILKYLNV
jgi:XTP/dITP diphosphohydrolase